MVTIGLNPESAFAVLTWHIWHRVMGRPKSRGLFASLVWQG